MESFEHTGIWWLPEEPEQRLAGILSFDPKVGGKLALTFEQPVHKGLGSEVDLYWEFPIVLGQMNGIAVTLKDCTVGSPWRTNYGVCFTTQTITIYAKTIFKGYHFNKIEDIVFEALSVSYTYLGKWMKQRSFEIDKEFGGVRPVSAPLEPVEISLNDHLKIYFWYKPNDEWDLTEAGVPLQGGVTLITIAPKGRLHYDIGDDNYFGFINSHLRDLLTFATGEPNYPFDIQSIVKTMDRYRAIDIYYQIPGYDPEAIQSLEMFFTFRFADVEGSFPKYLLNWICVSKELRSVCVLYFKSYYQRNLDLETQFLFLARALEGYHRQLYGGTYLSKEKYEPIAAALIKAICEQDLTESHKAKLKNAIKYGNEYSLRKRLKTICDKIERDHREVFKELLEDPKDFISKVVETRNNLIHLDGSSTDAIPEDKLPEYIRKMRRLLRLCFLVEMGLQPDDIKTLRQHYPGPLSSS